MVRMQPTTVDLAGHLQADHQVTGELPDDPSVTAGIHAWLHRPGARPGHAHDPGGPLDTPGWRAAILVATPTSGRPVLVRGDLEDPAAVMAAAERCAAEWAQNEGLAEVSQAQPGSTWGLLELVNMVPGWAFGAAGIDPSPAGEPDHVAPTMEIDGWATVLAADSLHLPGSTVDCYYCARTVAGGTFTRYAVSRSVEIICCAACWDDAMILHEAPGPTRTARLQAIIDNPRHIALPGTGLGQQLHMAPDAAAEWARQQLDTAT